MTRISPWCGRGKHRRWARQGLGPGRAWDQLRRLGPAKPIAAPAPRAAIVWADDTAAASVSWRTRLLSEGVLGRGRRARRSCGLRVGRVDQVLGQQFAGMRPVGILLALLPGLVLPTLIVARLLHTKCRTRCPAEAQNPTAGIKSQRWPRPGARAACESPFLGRADIT
jgi:hypothetical protein